MNRKFSDFIIIVPKFVGYLEVSVNFDNWSVYMGNVKFRIHIILRTRKYIRGFVLFCRVLYITLLSLYARDSKTRLEHSTTIMICAAVPSN